MKILKIVRHGDNSKNIKKIQFDRQVPTIVRGDK
jgi:hypothetical protein